MLQGRRKLKNLVLFPESQVRYGILFLALATFTHVILTVAVLKIYSGWNTKEEATNAPVWLLVAGMIVVYFILQAFAFVLGLLMSHKIFGPLVAIRNFVNEIKAGNYSNRVNLRKQDDPQLLALADALNSLADSLASKKR
jgi:signal transduction histidine kinase